MREGSHNLSKGLLAATLLLAAPAPALADSYNVFCSNNRIEVQQRTLEQQLSARGTPTCQLSGFSSYSSALDFAKANFGGEGQACTCGD
ncbi:hypothetical protein [Zavarzinia sp. CC-PAN008]|uniref:hypothetical protein n=1 Tax=Zavarzinia sp. CC-PAN008 TaxID=3243332 RepID=UPI003F74490E